ncbi:MAG: hypothetical protein CMC14_14625 [Flavobacteriaceae bacterium]|nr:hypothetical protein [Flavobacteriaceae bacterium]
MNTKIGLLLPRSDMFPTLAGDILNGLKLVFKKKMDVAYTPSFIIEGTGNAADDSIIQKAEKLLLQEDVDLTIAFCSIFKLKELEGVFTAYKKPLLHIDLGGRILKKEHVSPNVLYHTLNIWQASYAAGRYAVNAFGKKAAIVGSYYDCGYQITEAFVQGLNEEGGKVEAFWVGPMDYKAESYDAMIEAIKQADPDFIYALFSYKEGEKVFRKIAGSEINGRIPILSNPLMNEETLEDYKIEKVTSIASWSLDDENPEMKSFITDYKSLYSENPNILSLMGFEIGQLVSKIIEKEHRIPSNIGEYMANKKIETPRGTVHYNAYNESYPATFKVRQFKFRKDNYQNVVTETLDASVASNQNEKFEESPLAGWQNPYICT